MARLTVEDLEFFNENGYVRVPSVVPRENVDAVVDAIWEFLGMNRDDPEDWYRLPLTPGGMIEMYQHPAMWNNRQFPGLYEPFTQIFGTDKLWVSLDRVNLKPPYSERHPEFDHKGFIHWDTDSTKPKRLTVQGVLYLRDTTPDMGGFCCVPSIFRDFDEWVKTQPADRSAHSPDITGHEVVAVPGNAGDLVIWHSFLPHGNGRNVAQSPRLAQFISMFPTRQEDESLRQDRIYRWQNLLPPTGRWVIGDERNWEQTHLKPAQLSPLGRKLLGLDRWD